jgi:hypothetical protein
VTKYKDNFQAVEGADGMSWQQASFLRQGASRPYPMRMCGMEHPSTRPDARLVIAAIAKAGILKFGRLQHAWCKQLSGFAISGRRARSAVTILAAGATQEDHERKRDYDKDYHKRG